MSVQYIDDQIKLMESLLADGFQHFPVQTYLKFLKEDKVKHRPSEVESCSRLTERRNLIIEHHHRLKEEKYKARIQSRMELFKTVIMAGQSALKFLMMLNGGAALAMLTFVGTLAAIKFGDVNQFALPICCFVTGSGLAVLSAGLTYLGQREYAQNPEKKSYLGDDLNVIVIVTWASSFIAFIVGVANAIKVFANLQI